MSKLAVLFPGLGYTCERPLLYYGGKLAAEAGFTERHIIKYEKIDKTGLQGNKEKMLEVYNSLYQSTKKDLSEINWNEYDEILFLSKSIGTAVAATIEKDLLGSPETKDLNIRQILFTPLEQTFIFHPKNAIGFIGTNDPWCDSSEVIRLAKEQNIPMSVYEGANHSLETGDALKDIENIKDVMNVVSGYLNIGR
ncbi:MAG: alpha/beta hydrolase [Lachnospiraceae bacterium]|nr:alpha/beta hydrolase [Lachnospiraceae bacterium]